MTEKRFEINNLVKKGNMSFWDNENKSILNSSHTLDLLNSLSEENEHLKKLLKCFYKDDILIHVLDFGYVFRLETSCVCDEFF